MALRRPVTASGPPCSLEFQAEFFNAFSHAQFYGNGAVNGDRNNCAFGLVTGAAAPGVG
ncbi:MAG: hypothetical protein ACRD2B_12825 [Terriglobia bacterium]